MIVNLTKEGSKLIVTVEGKIGAANASELEEAVINNIGGVTELVFDFEKLDYMASAGLRVLLSSAKRMKKQGTMKLINVMPSVMEVLRFTGMADVLDIETV